MNLLGGYEEDGGCSVRVCVYVPLVIISSFPVNRIYSLIQFIHPLGVFIYSLPALPLSTMLVQLGDLQVKMDSRVPGEWYHSKDTIYYVGEITY